MDNLTTLANRYGSDKGTAAGREPHRYSLLYDLLFYPLRDADISVAEIGLAIGGPEGCGPVERQVSSPSVAMWLSYFSRARIFGFDISDFSHIRDDRFSFIRGDSGSARDLQRFAHAAGGFDIVIDDGSHASFHQQLALRELMPHLRPGGLYVIEDLHWQSPFYESRLPIVPRTSDFLRNLFLHDIYIENSLFTRSDAELLRSGTESFAVFPDFSERRGGLKLAVLRATGSASSLRPLAAATLASGN